MLALLYMSLSTSVLGKQWLNRYIRRQGGSAAERCGDRQRKLNGLQRWPFGIVIESLPILQLSLLLLGAALSRFLWGVNRMVASIVTGFTTLAYYSTFASSSRGRCPTNPLSKLQPHSSFGLSESTFSPTNSSRSSSRISEDSIPTPTASFGP